MGEVTGAVFDVSLFGSNEVKQFVLERKLTAGEIEKLKSAGLLTKDGIISIKTQANLIKFDRICGTSFSEKLDSEETVGNISAIAGALTESLDGLMGKKPSEMSLIELASLALIINLLSSQDKERLSRELKSRLDTVKIQEIQKKFFTAVKAAAEQLQSAQSQIKAEMTQSIIGLATSVAGSILGIGASSVSAVSSGKLKTQETSQQFNKLKQGENAQQQRHVQNISNQLKTETTSLKKDLDSQYEYTKTPKMEEFDAKNAEVQNAQKQVEETQKVWENETNPGAKQNKQGELTRKIEDLKTKRNELERKIGELERKIGELETPDSSPDANYEYRQAERILAEHDLEISQSELSLSKSPISKLTEDNPRLGSAINELDSALKSGDQGKINEAKGKVNAKINNIDSISVDTQRKAKTDVDAYVGKVEDVNAKRKALNDRRVDERHAYNQMVREKKGINNVELTAESSFIKAQKTYLNDPSSDSAKALKDAKDDLIAKIEGNAQLQTNTDNQKLLKDQTQYAYLEAVSSKQSQETVKAYQKSIEDKFTEDQSKDTEYNSKIDKFDKQIYEAYNTGNSKEAIKLNHEKAQYEAQKKLKFAEGKKSEILNKYEITGEINDNTDLTHLTPEDQGELLGALKLKDEALREMLNIDMYSASEHQYKSALAGVAQSFASMFQQSGVHLGSLIAVGDKMTASIKQYESSVTQAAAGVVDTVLRSLDEFRSTVDSGKSRGLADMEKAVQMYQSMVLEYINTLKSIISLI